MARYLVSIEDQDGTASVELTTSAGGAVVSIEPLDAAGAAGAGHAQHARQPQQQEPQQQQPQQPQPQPESKPARGRLRG